MKRLNKTGPPVLYGLPRPRQLSAAELASWLDNGRGTLIDAASPREEFFTSHLEKALHAPLDRSFSTVIGSLVRPEDDLVLLVEEENLEGAIRSLVRIGFDHIVGWVPPESLESPELSRRLRRTPTIDFDGLGTLRREKDVAVLDVRGAAEFATGHVPGATNIAHTRLPVRRDELPEGKALAVYCRSGARAAAATAWLEKEGYAVTLVADRYAPRSPAEAGSAAARV